MKKSTLGFSLVELITVILLISILAVSVLPNFTGSDDFEVYSYRSQLISDLRLVQQRAMQQTALPNTSSNSYCHHLVFEASRYGIPDKLDCTVTSFPSGWVPDQAGMVVDNQHNIVFSVSGAATANLIHFDSMGRPTCANGCVITVSSAVESVQIRIETQGYIHAI